MICCRRCGGICRIDFSFDVSTSLENPFEGFGLAEKQAIRNISPWNYIAAGAREAELTGSLILTQAREHTACGALGLAPCPRIEPRLVSQWER
jgi:hypothetical protein